MRPSAGPPPVVPPVTPSVPVAAGGDRVLLGFALGLVGVVIFGATLPATQIALTGFPPWSITVGRAVMAGVAAAIVLLVLRRPFPRGDLKALAIVAVAVTVGFPGFTALALRTVPAGHGGVVLGILPLATAIAAAFVAGERPSPAFWALSFLGAALVTGFTIWSAGGLEVAAGDLYLVAACASAAIGYAWSGVLARRMPGWEVISWALVLALPFQVLAMLPMLPTYVADVPAAAWWAFVYVGLFSQFIGFFFWNAGLALGGVARVGQVQLLQTFVTLAIAAFLLGERVDAVTLGFAGAVAFVVLLGRRTRVSRRDG